MLGKHLLTCTKSSFLLVSAVAAVDDDKDDCLVVETPEKSVKCPYGVTDSMSAGLLTKKVKGKCSVTESIAAASVTFQNSREKFAKEEHEKKMKILEREMEVVECRLQLVRDERANSQQLHELRLQHETAQHEEKIDKIKLMTIESVKKLQ